MLSIIIKFILFTRVYKDLPDFIFALSSQFYKREENNMLQLGNCK